MCWNRLVWRTARRLEAAYPGAVDEPNDGLLPETAWSDARATLRRLAVAQRRAWRAAMRRESESAGYELEVLIRRLQEQLHALRNRERRCVPSVRLLYEELSGLFEQFDQVDLDRQTVSVTTEPIVLEGIALGRFSIRLEIERIDRELPFRVVALDPNPAATSSETTHPHVNAERLCAGEGRAPLAAALAEGRLYDFFLLVNQVLKTFAAGSAFVELDRWYGIACHDCDVQIDEGEASTCNHCDEQVCGDCLVPCQGCGDGYCAGCIERCQRCEEPSCAGCLVRCRHCRRHVCDGCREDELCETCREELEEEQNAMETEEESEAAVEFGAEPAVCPDGLGQTPLSP